MLPKTLETINTIKRQVLHEKRYGEISGEFYTCDAALKEMMLDLSEKQQRVIFDYIWAYCDVYRAVLAIALHDEP